MLAEAPIGGRYRPLRELGRGATGRVVLAEDLSSEGALRAVKLVGPADLERLGWEFEHLRAVAHPNVARVHELLRLEETGGRSPGGGALVVEYAPGRSAQLAALEATSRGARLALALRVGLGVARGLSAIHARGLTHGDIKPQNVVVDPDPASPVVLIDLGMAAAPGSGPADRVSGTLGFMAPELLRGERGPAADLFALGVTLARILEGQAPGRDTGQLPTPAQAALLSPLEDWVPSALRNLIADLTAEQPQLRPARALDAVARLSALDGAPEASAAQAHLDAEQPTPDELSLRMEHLPATGLQHALAALQAAGRGGVVVVHGPDGAGRSRLVREFAGRAQRAGLAAGERIPTYRAVSALPGTALGHDTLLHVLPQAVATLEQLRLLVVSAAVEGAELTVIWERADALDDDDVPHVEVGPLDEEAVRALLSEAIGDAPSTSLVREAVAASGGLAGRLCRLLALGAKSGVRKWSGARMRELSAGRATDALSVPAEAGALSEVLAVAGGALPVAAARAAVPDCGQQAALLRVAGLLSFDDGGALCLRRDAVEALLGAMPSRRRVAVAATVPAEGLDAEAAAQLLIARGQPAEGRARLLQGVAEARAAGRSAAAVAMASRVAPALGAQPGSALRVAWADALRATGRYADAITVVDGQAAGADDDQRLLHAELSRLCGDAIGARRVAEALVAEGTSLGAGAHAILARLCVDAGELREARVHLEAAGEGGGARLGETRALCQLYGGQPDEAHATAAEALSVCRRAGDVGAEGRLCSVAAWCLQELGRSGEASVRLADAVRCAERAGEEHALAVGKMNLAIDGTRIGDLGGALEALRDAARRLARLGRDADVARALYNLAYVRHLCGDLDGADAAARLSVAAAVRCGDDAARQLAEGMRAEVAVASGDTGPARAWLAALSDSSHPSHRGGRVLRPADAASVQVRAIELSLSVDDGALAQAHLEWLGAHVQDAGADAVHEAAIATARVALSAGDATRALDLSLSAHAATAEAGFDLRLRSALCAAACASAAGQGELAQGLRAEVRAALDSAAHGLSLAARARLRQVPAYRRAWEAAPPPEGGDAPGMDDARGYPRLLALAKRFMGERRPERLYEHILDAALELAGAERGCLLLRRPDGMPRLRASRGLTGEELSDGGPTLSRSVVTRVLSSGQPMSTVDALSDARLAGAESVHALSLRSVAAVPLWSDNEVAGAIYIEDRLRPFAFRDHEMRLLVDLAHLSSIALDSVRALRSERRNARRLSAVRSKLARQVQTQAVELSTLRRQAGAGGRGGMVGGSAAVAALLDLLERVAPADVPVLVLGESGTGKELAARALHAASTRSDAPFVGENCSAIPESLLESALFGHVRGAFTGADRARTGLFEAADGGTLFLDEVGEMSAGMQARLLRVLENGLVRPVGGEREHRVDVRVVTATHRNLPAMVEAGDFREDLYYRLAVVTVEVPALRQRTEDIQELVAHFCAKHGEGRRVRVATEVLPALRSLPWPGNVRQLENEVRRALVLAEDEIRLEHFSPRLLDPGHDGSARDGHGGKELRAQVDRLERRLIREALAATDGNQTRAAKALGVSRFGLQKMIKRLSPLM